MKALILAGGRGKRLTRLTRKKNKSMLEIFGKPLIEYNLDQAVDMGVKEIIIVVGYRSKEIINHVGKEYRGIKYPKLKLVSDKLPPKQTGLKTLMEEKSETNLTEEEAEEMMKKLREAGYKI